MSTPWIGGSYEPRARKWYPQTESDLVLAGQRARRTATFAMGFAGGYDEVGLQGARQRVTATLALSAKTPVSLTGVRNRRTASFTVLPGAIGHMAADRQRITASFSIANSEGMLLSGQLRRRTASFQILPVITGGLVAQRQRVVSNVTFVPGLIRALASLDGYRQRRRSVIIVQPFASVTSLSAVRRRRISQIEIDVSNDSPEDLASASNIIRWTFRSGGQFARVPINPREMSTPTTARNMQWAWGAAPGAIMRGVDLGVDQPAAWTFTGVLLTKSHYDLLSLWTRGLATVQITDHLNRTFETIIQKFDPVERLPTASREWRADYTMTCLLLRRVA